MTAIVGVTCTDGVVIGTDAAVTLGASPSTPTIEQPIEKLAVIDDAMIVAFTGMVGLGQRFLAVVEQQVRQKRNIQKSALQVGKTIAREAITDFASTKTQQLSLSALIGFPCADGHGLVEFVDSAGFQPECRDEKLWYTSMGSTQSITDPFLGFVRRVFWHDGQPNVQDAIFAVTWTLQHAIDLNPGGVKGPASVAVLERPPYGDGDMMARILPEGELYEYHQHCEAAEQALRDHRIDLKEDRDTGPPVPGFEPDDGGTDPTGACRGN